MGQLDQLAYSPYSPQGYSRDIPIVATLVSPNSFKDNIFTIYVLCFKVFISTILFDGTK